MSYFDREKNPYGINKNSHYFALMNPICGFGFFIDGSKYDWVECEIVEDRYKVDDGYKVTLKPLDNNHASQHFYQCDFISLMKSGHIVEKTNDSLHIEHEEIHIPLTDTVYLVYSGDYITDYTKAYKASENEKYDHFDEENEKEYCFEPGRYFKSMFEINP